MANLSQAIAQSRSTSIQCSGSVGSGVQSGISDVQPIMQIVKSSSSLGGSFDFCYDFQLSALCRLDLFSIWFSASGHLFHIFSSPIIHDELAAIPEAKTIGTVDDPKHEPEEGYGEGSLDDTVLLRLLQLSTVLFKLLMRCQEYLYI